MTESQIQAKQRKKFSLYFYNTTTYVGVFLALFVFILEIFLFGISVFSGENLYLGMITYVALPPFLFLGLFLIPIGAWRKRRKVRAGTAELQPKTFKIDPSIPTHRNAVFVFLTGTFILILMSVIGAYQAYQYTESVKFCGLMCHSVMRPEFTAYNNSPHARVKCVECHIGEGVDWYVKSKLSGLRQVVKVLTNTYELPIATPVKNLRPASETCQQCHWPGKFYGTFDFRRNYYLTEPQAEPWTIRMLLSVGGGEKEHVGVHAHMNVDHEIYYAADDEKRLKISWVKSVDKSGKEVVYVSSDSPYKETPPADDKIRKMDCIDCHNRPTHKYLPPYQLLNTAMQTGQIDPSLPDIKKKGLELLSAKYKSHEDAAKSIREKLETYYMNNHPVVDKDKRKELQDAIGVITQLFQNNVFPEEHVRWDTHLDNIGHMYSPGCFRCHDGDHRAADGQVITKDCQSCHTIVEQGPISATEKNIDGLEFRHPTDISDMWQEMNCVDCHTGGE